MAAKKVLKLEADYEYDFLMAGVICSYKDYRFCYELNEAFDLAFKRQEDYKLYLGKPGATALFSFYVAEDRYGIKYYVLSNKSVHATLIPEKPAFDYFFIVKNYGARFDFPLVIKKIKDIQMVTAIAELDPLELKSSDNLLFD
ncbi:MAG TPA: IPExxxVDY family protein [Bacteroidia bacterium]|nr:MAG: hypothetical protein UZ10_BCD003000430 [Bacteroidetes bacterium OLB10]MBE7510896.1 IPExxxVDY family protein [Bacteroidia bacterium]MBX3106559.1 IPExxxVDY family protein [Bacteroidota bacterium]MCE7955608.1 IPExxxVDY family protein [Bacteroidetes bacterium CHB6]OQB62033.1 MAG: hypothetical protein BWX95_01559 [Bacteroidetes bacterium ADurb.Bin141]